MHRPRSAVYWFACVTFAVACGDGGSSRPDAAAPASGGSGSGGAATGGTTSLPGSGGAVTGGTTTAASSTGGRGGAGGTGGTTPATSPDAAAGGAIDGALDGTRPPDVESVDARSKVDLSAADTPADGVDGGPTVDAPAAGLCHSVSECPPTVPVAGQVYTIWFCVASDQSPPPSYVSPIPPGMCTSSYCPNWCGSSTCPTQPTSPVGTNLACTTSADCSQQRDAGSGAVATLCSNGKCTECLADADCPGSRPACAAIGSPSAPVFRMCSECNQDTQCPGVHPYCVVPDYLGGSCRDCRTTADCADGVCGTSHTCVPGCAQDSDCDNPGFRCTSLHRCEPISCAGGTACPADATCASGVCQRSTCTADSDCQSNACVNGRCYARYGLCMGERVGV